MVESQPIRKHFFKSRIGAFSFESKSCFNLLGTFGFDPVPFAYIQFTMYYVSDTMCIGFDGVGHGDKEVEAWCRKHLNRKKHADLTF